MKGSKASRRKKKYIRNTVIIFAVITAAVITAAVISDTRQKESSSRKTSAVSAETRLQQKADSLMRSMSLEEKVGQMFMGCFYSGTPSPEEVTEYHLGSVLLFGQSFTGTTPEKLRLQISGISKASDIRPFIAVDEEGGTVVRVSSSTAFRRTPFKSPRQLYAEGGLEAIVKETHEKNELLSGLGINLNLAPVCDISTGKEDFMYSRSLGQDAGTTSDFAEAVVKACADDGMGCTLKHFPGYGDAADTHKGLATDDRSLKELKSCDLLPFKAGIEAGAPSVLVSHNIVTALDDKPASLSKAVHKLLREDLGFKGVIITDDLSMDAISEYFSGSGSAVTAIQAGNDMLCTGDFSSQYEAVLKAVSDGTISESRIDQSVRRILVWKIQAGLV